MRVDLLTGLAKRMQLQLSPALLKTIAMHITGGARELQGALNQLQLVSDADGRAIDRALIDDTLLELSQQHARPVKLADIQRAVCDVCGVEGSSLRSDGQARSIVEPRMLAMYLSRQLTRAPLREIGEFYGRTSHSTVISANRRVEKLISAGGTVHVGDRECSVEDALRKIESALRRA